MKFRLRAFKGCLLLGIVLFSDSLLYPMSFDDISAEDVCLVNVQKNALVDCARNGHLQFSKTQRFNELIKTVFRNNSTGNALKLKNHRKTQKSINSIMELYLENVTEKNLFLLTILLASKGNDSKTLYHLVFDKKNEAKVPTLIALLNLPVSKKIAIWSRFFKFFSKTFEGVKLIGKLALIPMSAAIEIKSPDIGATVIGDLGTVLEEIGAYASVVTQDFKNRHVIIHPMYYRSLLSGHDFLVPEEIINHRNSFGDTPLHLAAKHNNHDEASLLAWLLRVAGANPYIRNKQGKQPAYYALVNRNYKMVTMLEKFIMPDDISGGYGKNILKFLDNFNLHYPNSQPKRSLLLYKKNSDNRDQLTLDALSLQALQNALTYRNYNYLAFDMNDIKPDDFEQLKKLVEKLSENMKQLESRKFKVAVILKNLEKNSLNDDSNQLFKFLFLAYPQPFRFLMIGITQDSDIYNNHHYSFGRKYPMPEINSEVKKKLFQYFVDRFVPRYKPNELMTDEILKETKSYSLMSLYEIALTASEYARSATTISIEGLVPNATSASGLVISVIGESAKSKIIPEVSNATISHILEHNEEFGIYKLPKERGGATATSTTTTKSVSGEQKTCRLL